MERTLVTSFIGRNGNKIYLIIGKDDEGYNTVKSAQPKCWKIVTRFEGPCYRCMKKVTNIKLECEIENTMGVITETIEIDFSKYSV